MYISKINSNTNLISRIYFVKPSINKKTQKKALRLRPFHVIFGNCPFSDRMFNIRTAHQSHSIFVQSIHIQCPNSRQAVLFKSYQNSGLPSIHIYLWPTLSCKVKFTKNSNLHHSKLALILNSHTFKKWSVYIQVTVPYP